MAPAVTIAWIDPDGEAARLVGEGNALAFITRRAAVIPPWLTMTRSPLRCTSSATAA
jgi:hypothetical protein